LLREDRGVLAPEPSALDQAGFSRGHTGALAAPRAHVLARDGSHREHAQQSHEGDAAEQDERHHGAVIKQPAFPR
jgi:hypothetical protein